MREPVKHRGIIACVQKTYENAIPVLVHEDRYQHTVSEEASLDSFVYLLGAFQYNGATIPVQFELKHINDKTNKKYIVATIKEDVSSATSTTRSSNVAPTSSTKSIAEVIANVKPEDTAKILRVRIRSG